MDGGSSNPLTALLLCMAAALLEGFDNQSMGVAAPKLVSEFALSPAAISWIFSAATIGWAIGAAFGGRIADRYGRPRVLAFSVLLFAACSLLTAMATGSQSLFAARLFTGLGFGGALPNFIAIASDATPRSKRLAYVTIIMAGMPFGGLLAGAIALLAETQGWPWRVIFYVGSAAPLFVAFAVWTHRQALTVPGQESRLSNERGDTLEPTTSVLFGGGRAITTLELFVGFFFTQLVLLLMLNWLPSLFVGLGFSRPQASLASMCFNLFGAASSLVLGRLHAGPRRRLWVLITYGGMGVALTLLPFTGHTLWLALLAASLAGLFIIGAQLVLFALAPLYYEQAVRGTGVGAAVSVGRLGSVFGPLYAGALLAGGGGSGTVLLGIIPFVIIGGLSTFALCWRPQCRT